MGAALGILRQWQPAIEAATLVAVIIYVWKTWSMAREMKLSREETSKPSVICYFEPNSEVFNYFDFVVKNYGHSAAIDVELIFNPELRGGFGQRMTNRIFKLMPPGYEWRTLWDSFVRLQNDPAAHSGYTARVSYHWGHHKEREEFGVSFDAKSIGDRRRPGVATVEDSLEKIAQSIEEIQKTLKPGGGDSSFEWE